MWRNHGNRWRMAWSSAAERVSDDVALAAVDLFPGVIARYTAAFGRLHALAVDDARCGTGLAAADRLGTGPEPVRRAGHDGTSAPWPRGQSPSSPAGG